MARMANESLIPRDIQKRFDVYEWRNGIVLLHSLHPEELRDIFTVLREFELLATEVIRGGKNKSDIAKRFDDRLYEIGWAKRHYQTIVKVDDDELRFPSHEIDCIKNRVALEVEWNNKDPFFDRDLTNFRHLYNLGVIDVGVIITRASELQSIFAALRKASSYGKSTTHIEKLLPKMKRDGSGGCPVVVFGITKECYVDDR